MEQEQKFKEVLDTIRVLAEAEGNMLSDEKIRSMFLEDGIELTDEQFALVCDYLHSLKIDVSENSSASDGEEQEDVGEDKDAEFFAMYKHDLKSVRKYSEEELEELMKDFAANKDMLTQAFLRDVIKWIEPYKNSGLYVCDLVQEGNMGLIEGVATFRGDNITELKKHLKECVRDAVSKAVIEQEGEDNISMKILGRVNAVNDCAKEMAKKLGRKVGVAELAQKLNMTVEEIREINELSGYKLEDLDDKK